MEKYHVLINVICEQSFRLGLPFCEEVMQFLHKGPVPYTVSNMSLKFHEEKNICKFPI